MRPERASSSGVDSPLVAIVILNWNQKQLTLDCLDSLSRVDYPRFRTILVDNGSADGSVEAIRAGYPGVAIIENGENLGFSEANNIGMRRALADGADYVLLLNNDTVVDPGFLSELIEVAERDPSIGVVTPKIYYFDEPHRIWCAGAHINWRTGESSRLRAEEMDDASSPADAKEVNFVSACAMCVKRSVLEEVGLIDPRFFIYYDEADWCARITSAGYRCVYVPDGKIWHKVSAAMGTASPATSYYMTRNGLLFLSKHFRGMARIRVLGRTVFDNLRTVVAYSLKKRYRSLRHVRDGILFGLRDACIGRFGKMGTDVQLALRRD